mmetsp:Transcript_106304/g.189031  ORF Transcript_106304/g.189031 Transcript_106304/m.189031 type:complete len:366 (+) Transcript_106304:60-1157(+)|eukprot:CAMPEP_0197639686 /NCGR_PEP_ID=MMETSP1338-20131121/14234_1 /TAXON_ID=43686 ORGANISM="Pelagodinium beii, Strain RCC1491" /NCGR_SAMPLE_ID=MMETSP1338 /ASSEMBLY_ACC=CAM_ASM_000754 /LENGTH=365 /DNA_ID=CAMNT_0043212451 /DNA_START=57 /DNA_END=1154 /DNA_ORIENTATION=-
MTAAVGYPRKYTFPSTPAGGNAAQVLGPTSLVWSVRQENMPGTISGVPGAAPLKPVSLPTSGGTRETVDVGQKVLNLQKIEDPKVSIHQCKQKYGAEAIRSIFTKLEERDAKPVFEEINLSDTALGDDGAKYLADGLKDCKTLKTLLMPRSDVRANGFQAMGAVLPTLPNLEMLIMSGNLADPEGVGGEFRAGLSKNTSLKSLCLAACRLQDKGVQDLCEGPLRSHPKLEHISLNYNRLEDEACSSVAKMLAQNSVLEYLELCGNSISAAGAEQLVKGLKARGCKLKRLGLAQNNLRTEGSKIMCQHFVSAEGQSMMYLDLRHNITGTKGHIEIRKMLNKPYDSDDANKGWMINFGERQLMLNAL